MKKHLTFLVASFIAIVFIACESSNEYRHKNLLIMDDVLVSKYKADASLKEQFEIEFEKFLETVLIANRYQFIKNDSIQPKIITSADGNLRFYTWISPESGTIRDYYNVFQFLSEGRIYTCPYSPEAYMKGKLEFIDGIPGGFNFMFLKEVQVKDSMYYLVESNSNYGSLGVVSTVTAYKIANNKVELADIFKSGNVLLNRLSFRYDSDDWYYRTNGGEGHEWLFAFSEKESTLYLPMVEDNISPGFLTDRYQLFKLTNNAMEYVGVDGGYWLHSSLRDFKCLVGVYENDSLKIRIDCVDNGYRFAMWKDEKDMLKIPELLIGNGTYIASENKCFFKHGNITYTANRLESGMVIKRNGKVIL